jgi:membrane protein implicated in regulation of membrane protease activity
MNRAFLIIGIPAVAVSFYWLYMGYSLRAAIVGAVAEVALAVALVAFLRRKERQPRS